MAIQFNQIPGNIRVPFMRVEVNAGQQPYQSISRLLLIGQQGHDALAVKDTPVLVTGGEDGLFGYKSMLANMYRTARKNAPFHEIWALPLADEATATFDTFTATFTAAPVASGTATFTIDGSAYELAVATTDTPAVMAANLAATINLANTSRYIATAAAAVVTFKAKRPGVIGFAATVGALNVFTAAIAALSAVTAGTSTGQRSRGVIAVNSVPSASGSFVLYVGGQRIAVSVNSTLTVNDIAYEIAQAINDCDNADVYAIWQGSNVHVVANNFGTLHNTVRVETKMSPDDGDFSDLYLTITQMTGGAGDPAITTALAAMGSDEFDWIVMPFAQDAYLDEIEALLDDRWGPMEQTYGHAITAYSGTAGQAVAFGTARNSWHSTVFAMKNSPQATFHLAAALGALAAQHLSDAPELSRPLQTLQMKGIRPPKLVGDRWTTVERQSFYYAGISAAHVGPAGVVQLDRVVTTYQRNVWGSRDASWLDINTPAQLMYGIRSLVAGVTQQYPRAALMDENPGNIQGVATARDLRNAVVHEYRKLEAIGVFENTELFSQLLVVERNATDANRVDMFLPLDHVNQLRIIAVNATSFLQLNQ